MKRVLIVNSLVGVGRAGMYSQIAVLTHAGYQACPVPSAVLSTHTGGLGAPAKAVLTDELRAALEHYRALGVRFDLLISGYLASAEQADILAQFVADGYVDAYLCDPVLADGGKLYSGIADAHVASMRRLAALADVVTPNATEASLLLGRDPSDTLTDAEALDLARTLAGGRAAVVTGLGDASEAACAVSERGSAALLRRARERGSYPGSGDLFCGVLAASLVRGAALADAAASAMDTVALAVRRTSERGTDPKLGLEFEGTL